MAWIYLIVSGILEIVWAVSEKYTEGFTKFWPNLIMVVAAIISFYFLSYSMKTIPVGTAYIIFTAIGAVGTVLFGILFLNESQNLLKLGCISLIILGTIGLKLVGE